MRGQRDTGWGLYFGPQRHETGPCHVLCVATHEGTNRSKRGTAREGDGRASVGSLNGRTKTPKKTRQQKGRSSETPLKEKRNNPGYNRKQKRIKKTRLFQSTIFSGEFLLLFPGTWVTDSPPLKMLTKKTRNLFPRKWCPCFGLDVNSDPKSLQKLGAFVECRELFF